MFSHYEISKSINLQSPLLLVLSGSATSFSGAESSTPGVGGLGTVRPNGNTYQQKLPPGCIVIIWSPLLHLSCIGGDGAWELMNGLVFEGGPGWEACPTRISSGIDKVRTSSSQVDDEESHSDKSLTVNSQGRTAEPRYGNQPEVSSSRHFLAEFGWWRGSESLLDFHLLPNYLMGSLRTED